MRIGIFVLFFILLEVASFIMMASLIGGSYTLLLVLISIVAGALLLRQLGLSTGIAQMQALRSGQVIASSNATMPMYLWLVGILLVIPGFFSDLVALLILIPQVRAVVAAWFKDAMLRRVGQMPGGPKPRSFKQVPANEGIILDGECSDVADDPLPSKED